MARQQNALDRRPGPVPDISRDVRGLRYVIQVAGMQTAQRLVIRCDDEGEVWISIAPEAES